MKTIGRCTTLVILTAVLGAASGRSLSDPVEHGLGKTTSSSSLISLSGQPVEERRRLMGKSKNKKLGGVLGGNLGDPVEHGLEKTTSSSFIYRLGHPVEKRRRVKGSKSKNKRSKRKSSCSRSKTHSRSRLKKERLRKKSKPKKSSRSKRNSDSSRSSRGKGKGKGRRRHKDRDRRRKRDRGKKKKEKESLVDETERQPTLSPTQAETTVDELGGLTSPTPSGEPTSVPSQVPSVYYGSPSSEPTPSPSQEPSVETGSPTQPVEPTLSPSTEEPVVETGDPEDEGDPTEPRPLVKYENWEQVAPPVGGDNEGDEAGRSVAYSETGEYMAIGMPGYSIDGVNRVGKVRVYRLAANDQWEQYGADINGTITEGIESGFGEAVALSMDGQVLTVGARYSNSNAGEVTVYRYRDDTWNVLGSPSQGNEVADFCGFAVDASDDGLIVAVGCPGLLEDRPGYVMVFGYVGDTWTNLGTFNGTTNGDLYGSSVALSDSGFTLVIGSPGSDVVAQDAGSIFTYIYNTAETVWESLGDPIHGDSADSNFGRSLTISGEGQTIAYGLPGYAVEGSTLVGTVRVSTFSVADQAWVKHGEDLKSQSSGTEMGHSVSLSRDGLIVAYTGELYNTFLEDYIPAVIVYQYDGRSWVQLGPKIDMGWTGDHLDVELNSDGSSVLVGVNGFVAQGFAAAFQGVEA